MLSEVKHEKVEIFLEMHVHKLFKNLNHIELQATNFYGLFGFSVVTAKFRLA
jgi:hypothetical protein